MDTAGNSRAAGEKNGELLYSAQEAARLVGVSTQTLMVYERHGLVLPAMKRKARIYTDGDITWLNCLRDLIHVHKISIAALKKLLAYACCWEIKQCPAEQRATCGGPRGG